MRRLRRWVWCAVAMPAACAVADDWPTYKHDSSRVGRTEETLPAPLHQRWVFESSQAPQRVWPGPGGKTIENLQLRHRLRFDDVFHPVMAAGRAYFGSSVDHHVYCFDLATGELRWKFATAGPVRLAPTVDKGRIYVGSDDGWAYCLDATAGTLIWKRKAGPRDERILARGKLASRWPIRTSVLVDGGVAYFGAGTFPHEDVYLYAVDAVSGEVRWKNDTMSQRDAGRSDFTPQGYLLATDELLFVPSGRTLPAAFDRQTGRLVHKQTSGGKQIGGSEALLVENQIYSVGEHQFVALDQRGGAIVNRLPARQMTLHGSIAYLASGKEINAVDHQQFARAYQNEKVRKQYLAAKQELLSHPFTTRSQQLAAATKALADARSRLQELDEADLEETEQFLLADKAVESSERETALLKAQIAEVAADYRSRRLAAEKLIGVKWRVKAPHDSALILAGDVLVAGGHRSVIALDADSGRQLWETPVRGEARGLAAAGGFLTVGTTTGNVYCFGPAAGAPARQEVVRHAQDPQPSPRVRDVRTDAYAAAAQSILEHAGVKRGFCLVVGSEQGRLAIQLARQSQLNIYCVETDAKKVATSREALWSAGLYGSRVTVEHVADYGQLRFPNYFANLIVSDTVLRGGPLPGHPQRLARHLKPLGGVLCVGGPAPGQPPSPEPAASPSAASPKYEEWLHATGLPAQGAQLQTKGDWWLLTRAALPGAGAWTHQHGNAANTSSNADQRVQEGLSVLWYGDPGPAKMLNRHVGAVGPVSINGRLFVQGDRSLMAYDAYNGLKLWEYENAGAIRTGVFRNFEPGNLVASEQHVFNVIGDSCLVLEAATGQLVHRLRIPDNPGLGERSWGYVGYSEGKLVGTSTLRGMLPPEEQRRGRPASSTATDQLFAYDVASGELLWTHQGKSISHATVALDAQRVYFIDSSITSQQRQQMLRQDKTELRSLTGDERRIAEERQKRLDVRTAVALDAATGQALWAKPVDVTDCSEIGIGGGRLILMVHQGYLVLGGANANGHYWEQFLTGEFERRRLVVLSAETGEVAWAKDANYRHRPIIIGNRIIAEPWAFYLSSGEPVQRVHPITGEESAWMFARPGHHCGAISATPNMMFFRSGFTAYYDLEADSGTRHFGGHRLGCWINTIPANGLVLIPEASAGCACLFSLTSTVAFEPRADRQMWGVYGAHGATLPVQQLSINLGGPGDRRDPGGPLWLAYPRPSSRPGIDLPLDFEVEFHDETIRYLQQNSDSIQSPTPARSVSSEGTSRSSGSRVEVSPWIFASGAKRLKRIAIPLRREEDAPANYTVRLFFSRRVNDAAESLPTIRIQGETREAHSSDYASVAVEQDGISQEFSGVEVRRQLAIALSDSKQQAQWSLCGIQIDREDD